MATLMEKDILLEFSTSMVPDTFIYEEKFGKSKEMEKIRKEAGLLWQEIMDEDYKNIDYEVTMRKIDNLHIRVKVDIIDNLVRLKFNLVWNAEILDKSILKKLIIQYILLRKIQEKIQKKSKKFYINF